ncbi:MAG: ureidoglycolate lyase [Bacteroidota bacterium]
MRIQVRPIDEVSFRPYGRIFRAPTSGPLAETRGFSYWSDVASYEIEGATEIGWCVVRAHDEPIDWFERHDRTPEILIPVDAAVVLPVQREDGETVEAFRVEVGEAVILDSGVWHSACLPADRDEASYFVIFRRGTPSEDVVKTAVSEFMVEL